MATTLGLDISGGRAAHVRLDAGGRIVSGGCLPRGAADPQQYDAPRSPVDSVDDGRAEEDKAAAAGAFASAVASGESSTARREPEHAAQQEPVQQGTGTDDVQPSETQLDDAAGEDGSGSEQVSADDPRTRHLASECRRVLEAALPGKQQGEDAYGHGDSLMAGVALCSSRVLQSRLLFPFRQPRKIRNVIGLELETALPAASGDVLHDFLVGPTEGSGRSVLAVCMRRTEAAAVHGALRQTGNRPARLTTDAGALDLTAGQLKLDHAVPRLYVDVAPGRTVALLRRQQAPVAARTMSHGLSEMCGNHGVEDLLRNGSQGPEDAQRLEAAVRALVLELELFLESLGEQEPEMVVLSGEGAVVPGVVQLLEDGLSLPVRRIIEVDGYGPSAPSDTEETDHVQAACLAVAWGAALAAHRGRGLQFFQGELAPRERFALASPTGRLWMGMAAAVVLIWAAWLALGVVRKQRVLDEYSSRMAALVEQAAPNISGDFSPAQKVSILKGRIREARRDAELAGGGGRVLDVIRHTVAALDGNLDVELVSFSLSGNQAQLVGTADAFSTVEQAQRRLERRIVYDSVSVGATSTSSGSGRIRFSLDLKLKEQQ